MDKIAEIREKHSTGHYNYSYEVRDAIRFLLDEIDRLRAEVDRLKRGGWISVEERLPDEESHFIVADQYGNVFYSEYDEGGFWLDWDQEPDSVVTHWQPLPEPPKEGGTS